MNEYYDLIPIEFLIVFFTVLFCILALAWITLLVLQGIIRFDRGKHERKEIIMLFFINTVLITILTSGVIYYAVTTDLFLGLLANITVAIAFSTLITLLGLTFEKIEKEELPECKEPEGCNEFKAAYDCEECPND